MKHVKIALSRLYNAKFVQKPTSGEILWKQDYYDIKVVARLCKNTAYLLLGVAEFKMSNKDGTITTDNKTYVLPGPEKYPAELYFEIIAYKLIPVSENVSKLIDESNLQARDEIIEKSKNDQSEMSNAIDYCAGMLGLLVTPELVTTPIFEVDHLYIFMNENTYGVRAGFVFQTRATINIVHAGEGAIHYSMNKLKLTGKDHINKVTECFTWLTRGWAAEDYTLRFISFFTALESIIPTYKNDKKEKFNKTRKKLISLIRKSESSKEWNDEIIDLVVLKFLPDIPFLARFKKLASDGKLSDWEDDIKNLKTFYESRNRLLHGGNASPVKHQNLTNEYLNSFEALAQKYIRFILYGDKRNLALNPTRKSVVSVTANFIEKSTHFKSEW